ncbi:hypothetical protein Tco_1019474 [Tanacetum coccineum]|uniref:Uncharacterized protein n=1 Tax=Tanacetum coccineum TaxID=301880 RepID=A0ABQ5FXQ2_9ASTR
MNRFIRELYEMKRDNFNFAAGILDDQSGRAVSDGTKEVVHRKSSSYDLFIGMGFPSFRLCFFRASCTTFSERFYCEG